MAYAALYDDPQLDPEVRRRVMQRLQQPTGEPTAPGTPAPSASATPSPTFVQPSAPAPPPQSGNRVLPYDVRPPAPSAPSTAAAPTTTPSVGSTPSLPPHYGDREPPTPIVTPTPPTSAPGGPPPTPPATTPGFTYPKFTGNVQQYVQDFITANDYKGGQSIPGTLDPIVEALKRAGVNATLDQRSDGLHKGIMIDGKFIKLLDGSDHWIWDDGSGASASAGSSSAVPPGFGQTTNPFLEQIRQMLMERMGRDLQPVNENDSYISAPMSAARNEASRSSDAERKALAERLYASGGLNSNALETGIRQSGERTAIGLGSLRGQLIARELQARRADLNEAFQGALASGDAQMARQVQEAIAQLDAMLRREGYGVSLAVNTSGQNAATVGAGMNG